MTEHATSTCCHAPAGAATDLEDVRAVLDGDRAAFDRLVLRHQQKAVSTAYYFLGDYQDALEVAQEAFLAAYRSLESFRGGSSFRTWLLRIVVNQAKSLGSRRRAKKRSAPLVSLSPSSGRDDDRGLDPPDERFEPSRVVLRAEVKERLEQAITDLDADSREIIILRDLQGESYGAIGRALGLPLGTVKSKVHRARLEIREALRDYLEA